MAETAGAHTKYAMITVAGGFVLRGVIFDGISEPLHPLLMPEEDTARVCDEVTAKRVDLGLELFADLFKRFRFKGAAQRVVKIFEELGGFCRKRFRR